MAVGVACVLFFTLGCLLTPRAGIQNDEALFSSPLFNTFGTPLLSRIRHLDIPLMVMSYLGSLKSLLYIPIFGMFGASVWTVRLPMVVVGVATILLFYQLVSLLLGRRAAAAGAFLLAADPLFVMTNTFDWGPVALEHFFLVTGLFALCRFGQSYGSGTPGDPIWHGREKWLVLGGLCFGLAMWNKAIFAWALAGVVVGSLATCWGKIRRDLTLRHASIAAVAFLVGALPLVGYNLRARGATVSENAHLEVSEIPRKWTQLESALQGSGVFGYIAAEEWVEPRKEPATSVQRASAWVREQVGEYRRSGFYWALAGLLLLVPIWWRSRVAWFALLFTATSWLLMAATHDAGGAAHHTVLLWPMPHLFAVAVLSRLPRPALGIGVAGLALSGLLVTNQFYSQLVQHGAWDTWTDAVLALSDAVDERPGQTVYITDWGMFDTLNLLHKGRLSLRLASGPLESDHSTPEQLADLDRMLREPGALFLTHVPEREAFHGVGARLDARLGALGLRRKRLRTVTDSSGHPVFEISQIEPPSGQ